MKKAAYLICAALLAGCASASDPALTLKASQDSAAVDETVSLEIDGLDSSSEDPSFSVSGGEVDGSNGTYVFKADQPGTYTITAQSGSKKSSPLTITITEKENTEQDTENAGTSNTEDSTQTEQQPDASVKEETPVQITIAEFYSNPDAYLGKALKVEGNLPQSVMPDSKGNLVPVLVNDAGQKLVLTGEEINDGSVGAIVDGTITQDGDDYILNVTDYTIER